MALDGIWDSVVNAGKSLVTAVAAKLPDVASEAIAKIAIPKLMESMGVKTPTTAAAAKPAAAPAAAPAPAPAPVAAPAAGQGMTFQLPSIDAATLSKWAIPVGVGAVIIFGIIMLTRQRRPEAKEP